MVFHGKKLELFIIPQWNGIIKLPITNMSHDLEIQFKNENLIHDTKFGKFTIKINEISTKTIKK